MLSEKSLKRASERVKKCKVGVWLASKKNTAKVVKWVKSGEMGPGAAGLRCFGRDEEGTSRGLKRPRGRLATTSLHRRTNQLRHHLRRHPSSFIIDLIALHPLSSAIDPSVLVFVPFWMLSVFYSVIIFVPCSPSSKTTDHNATRQLQPRFTNTLAR